MKSYAALIISSYIASTRASSCNPQHAGGFRRLKTHATCYDGTGTSFRHIRSADQCAEKCTREGDMSSTLLLYGFDYDCDDDKCTCLYGTKWESGPKPNKHSRRNVACYGLEPFPPAPVPAPQPPQCNTYNEPCESDSDCMQGGFNPCTKCGKSRGTRYYKRCYGGDEGGEESEFLQSGESGEFAPASDSADMDKAEKSSFSLNAAEISLLSAQCNTLGESCKKDSDCQQGGFNPCQKCGDKKGTRYYRQCYSPSADSPTAAPTTPPPQCNTYNEPCKRDSDCMQGGFNPCTKCGTQRGTRYYRRCFGEGNENEELEFVHIMRSGLRGSSSH
ncbi:hypothetical protein THAOC_15629 [Thalassiosira oceanica]|uniref:Uncharacterized protein n=1 Tax=Thalassiosira oceanica TaxID=159749 RepID=K0SEG9_THAOC|nr:hypothetical protein THAOC_15629 [Thalassiosira oceanica]|eukprot:EJK63700.1 hypothetical protein THAOC_15629 [Thalassiosira oceanica]